MATSWLSDAYTEHRAWWVEHRCPEHPVLPSMGLFKAFRNFVHLVLKARQHPTVGTDWNAYARAPLGDMLMYLLSVHHAAYLPLELGAYEHKEWTDLDMGVGLVARAFSDLLVQCQAPTGYSAELRNAVVRVLSLCWCCGVEPRAAAQQALRKLKGVA